MDVEYEADSSGAVYVCAVISKWTGRDLQDDLERLLDYNVPLRHVRMRKLPSGDPVGNALFGEWDRWANGTVEYGSKRLYSRLPTNEIFYDTEHWIKPAWRQTLMDTLTQQVQEEYSDQIYDGPDDRY